MRALKLAILIILIPTIALATDLSAPIIAVPDAYKTCAIDSDCIVMEKGCSYCCAIDAVNIQRQSDYNDLAVNECASVGVPLHCTCEEFSHIPKCASGICQAVRTFETSK